MNWTLVSPPIFVADVSRDPWTHWMKLVPGRHWRTPTMWWWPLEHLFSIKFSWFPSQVAEDHHKWLPTPGTRGPSTSQPVATRCRHRRLLAVGLVVVGSLENIWFVGVIRLSCVWIEVHSSSTCYWVSSFRPHPLHIVSVYMYTLYTCIHVYLEITWSFVCHRIVTCLEVVVVPSLGNQCKCKGYIFLKVMWFNP